MCQTFQDALYSVQTELDELGLLLKRLEKENEFLIDCNWCKLEQIEKLELKLQSEMSKRENIDALEERISSKECELGVMARELEAQKRENQVFLGDKLRSIELERIKLLERAVHENARNETKYTAEQSLESKKRENLHLLRDNQRSLKRYLKQFESQIRANLEEMKEQLDESERITTAIQTENDN